jgi:molecular chaperone DnaJ
MSTKDYYDILGIEVDAAQREVKRAYRKMAMKYHPDRNPGDADAEQKFKRAAEAYEVLGNSDKRQIYDQFGVEGLDGLRGGSGGPDFSDVNDIFSEFNEIFGEMFGFGKNRKRENKKSSQRRGADLRHDLELDFDEAVFGTEKTIEIPRHAECATCGGSGARAGTAPTPCETCNGEGQVQHTQGFFTLSSTCPDCGGSGQVIHEHCDDCSGRGYVEETREITVSVPAGVDTGTRLRLRNEGETGRNGGPRGDLYVFLDVHASQHFERRGADLHYEASLNFAEAALGCELEVPTLNGPTIVAFQPGTQFGDVKVLEAQGVQRLEADGRGDLHIHAHVTIPRELDNEERELLSRLKRSMSEERADSSPEDEADDQDSDEDADILQPDEESADLYAERTPLQPPEDRAVGRDKRENNERSRPVERMMPTGE